LYLPHTTSVIEWSDIQFTTIG